MDTEIKNQMDIAIKYEMDTDTKNESLQTKTFLWRNKIPIKQKDE